MRANVFLIGALSIVCALSPAFGEDAATVFAAAEAQYRTGQYREALDAYRSFSEQFPADWRAEQARFTAAFILQKKLKDNSQAVQAFSALAAQKNNAPLAGLAQFHQAEAYEQSGEMQQAATTLETLLKTAPEHARRRESVKRLKHLRRTSGDETPEQLGWGHRLRGRKWMRRLKKAVQNG